MNNKIISIKKISTTEDTKRSIVGALNGMGIKSVDMNTSWSKIADVLSGIENYTIRYNFGETVLGLENTFDEFNYSKISSSFERLGDIPVGYNNGFLENISSLQTFIEESITDCESYFEVGDHINVMLNSKFIDIATDTAPLNWGYSNENNCNMVSTDKTTHFGALFRKANAEIATVKGWLSQTSEMEAGKYTLYLQVDQKVGGDVGTNIKISSTLNGTIMTASNLKVGLNMFFITVPVTDLITVDLGVGILEYENDVTQMDISSPYIHKGWMPFPIETGLN